MVPSKSFRLSIRKAGTSSQGEPEKGARIRRFAYLSELEASRVEDRCSTLNS